MPEVLEGVVEQEAAPAQGETLSTDPATGEQQESQEKPRGGFQKRIDKLTRHNTQLEQEREYWRNEALRKAPEKDTPKPTVSEPSENDFQTHAEYVKALARYEAKEAVKTTQIEQRTSEAKAQQQKALQEFQAKEQDFRTKTPDFDEVMAGADDVQATQAIIEEIISSGPELKYYLAKNPEEVERLNKLSPLALAREVGRIESRFTTSQEKTPAKVTGAPPPPTPTGKSSATSIKDPGEMTPAEYRTWRAKQNAK